MAGRQPLQDSGDATIVTLEFPRPRSSSRPTTRRPRSTTSRPARRWSMRPTSRRSSTRRTPVLDRRHDDSRSHRTTRCSMRPCRSTRSTSRRRRRCSPRQASPRETRSRSGRLPASTPNGRSTARFCRATSRKSGSRSRSRPRRSTPGPRNSRPRARSGRGSWCRTSTAGWRRRSPWRSGFRASANATTTSRLHGAVTDADASKDPAKRKELLGQAQQLLARTPQW